MDVQEIPTLTEVYAADKTNDVIMHPEGMTAEEVVAIIEEYKAEIESELKQSLYETLKPQLVEEVVGLLKAGLASNLRNEIAEELKATNHTVSALQNAFTNLPDIDQEELLQSIDEKNQAFLESAKLQLSDTQTSLIQASTERMSLEIAGKIAGMQELAVTQAKAQVAQQIKGLEQVFQENVELLAAELQLHATQALKQQMESESELISQEVIARQKQTLAQALVEHSDAQLEQSKQVHEAQLATLASACQAQVAQSQEHFNQQAQAISQALLEEASLYAEKLNQELALKLDDTQSAFEGQMTQQVERSQAEFDSKLASLQQVQERNIATLSEQFSEQSRGLQAESSVRLSDLQQALEANISHVTQQWALHLQALSEQNNTKAEHMHQTLLSQVGTYTDMIHSDAAQLLAQAQASMQTLQNQLLEQASQQIQSNIQEELNSLIAQKRADFRQGLDADIPEVISLLDDKIKTLVTDALPMFEEALLQKVKASLVASLSFAP